MPDKLFKQLSSKNNLKLAFIRLKTAQNIQYKNYYRNLFLAYELAEDDNINNLSDRLLGGSYKPVDSVRLYLPKYSGLHRPISLLYLDDLIVYQAIANIIANKNNAIRSKVENINVFSNLINRDTNSQIFFFRKWQEGYNAFIKNIKKQFHAGNRWVAHFDLASYYDTIDHVHLTRGVSQRGFDDLKKLLCDCLNSWSTPRAAKLNHGIPQGPSASDFLGEIYLLPIDLHLNKHRVKYLRYVDDIKIYGKTREEILNGIILLEKECKERGLIPQSKKYEIIEAKTEKEAIGKHPSLTIREKGAISKNKDETANAFINAFNPKTLNPSKIRYILKASPQNTKILRFVLNNLKQRPEFSVEFCAFLSNYISHPRVGESIFEKGLKNPSQYDFVEGQYWGLLSDFSLSKTLKRSCIQIARNRLKKANKQTSLKIGLYKFLASLDGIKTINWIKHEPNAFVQAMAPSSLSPGCFNTHGFLELINHLLKIRSHYEPALICIKELIYSFNFSYLKRLIPPHKDSSGVITNTIGKPTKIDSIGQILSKRFTIPYSNKWGVLLARDYQHANHILAIGDDLFKINRNTWALNLDSFNEIVIRKFINLLNSKHILPRRRKWPKIINSKGELVPFGSLMDKNNRLSKTYANIIDGFRELHNRRCRIPTGHPFELKTTKRTINLKPGEQNKLIKKLCGNYNNLLKTLNKYIT